MERSDDGNEGRDPSHRGLGRRLTRRMGAKPGAGITPPCGLLFLASALIAACASGDPGRSGLEETPPRARQAIVGGSLDTTHDATVSIVLRNGGTSEARCSGTIVRVSGAIGTVITSAHCFGNAPTSVTIETGPDHAAPVATFAATRWTLYPVAGAVSEPYHDLALIEFAGAAGQPTLPLVKPADYVGYAASSTFTVVGYGLVTAGGSGSNSERKMLGTTFFKYQLSWLTHRSASGSTCFGDSGGTVIDSSTGTERLVAVTQGGNCNGANDLNSAVAFYAPEISAWLRENGFDMPAAPTLPNGAECGTNDALCGSGACLRYSSNIGDLFLCGDKQESSYTCERRAQCQSNFCHPVGVCLPCASASSCAAGEICSSGTCVTAPAVDAGAPVVDAGSDGSTPAQDAAADANDMGEEDGGVEAARDAATDDASNAGSSGSGSNATGTTPSSPTSSSDVSSAAPPTGASAPETAEGDAGCSASPAQRGDPTFAALLLLALLFQRRAAVRATRRRTSDAQAARARRKKCNEAKGARLSARLSARGP